MFRVYVNKDGHVILCPECNSQDEVMFLTDGQLLESDERSDKQFECGECGETFNEDEAGLQIKETFKLRSRGHVLEGPYEFVTGQ